MTAAPAADKWRPSLGLVVLAMLATVAALPLLGLSFVRLYENQLLRQTEGELIAQSAVVAAVLAREIDADPARADMLGSVAPEATLPAIEPALDLTAESGLPRRPEATDPSAPPVPAAMAIAARLAPVLSRVRTTTLAGFRITDSNGIVILGGDEVGRSLAGIDEVASALAGRFRAVLRERISKHPQPPLSSLSRGTSVRVFTAMPVLVEGRVAGVVYASRTPNDLMRQLYGEWGKVVAMLLAVLGATLLIALVFTRAIGRPIQALAARAVALGEGEPVAPAPHAHFGTREIALLGQSLEAMALRLRERSDYVATFATHVSHELKSPLTAIRGAAELLRDDGAEPDGAMSPAERTRFLDNIVSDTARLAALLGRLRELARVERPQLAGSTSLQAVVATLRHRFPQLDVQAGGSPGPEIGLSEENAGIVFGHLADNAARHSAGSLTLTVFATGHVLRIRVGDDGRGIPERDRSRVFEPFFTTRREDGGTGMGLGIVRSLLRAHGGSIELLPAADSALFEITLPVVESR